MNWNNLNFCFSENNVLVNSSKCKDKKKPKKCKKLKKKKKCNKKKVWKKCMKTCGRCSGCPGNQVPNPNHPDECFCPGDLVLDTNNPDQCVCQGNKIPDQSNSSHCICPANQILDINNPFQCLCHNGQFPNMTRQCSKYIFLYDLYQKCLQNIGLYRTSRPVWMSEIFSKFRLVFPPRRRTF